MRIWKGRITITRHGEDTENDEKRIRELEKWLNSEVSIESGLKFETTLTFDIEEPKK
jgi:hypothetical protein